MVYDNSLELRFAETMEREGVLIENVTKGKEVQVFFRRCNYNMSREIKKVFYKLDDMDAGDTLQVNGEYYIALNRSNENSNVYSCSTLERCSETWNIFGQSIHVICQNTLMDVSTDTMGTFGQISGTLTCIVTDMPAIHKACTVDSIFITFKGCHKIKNTFYDKGLAYIYLEKCPVSLSGYAIATEDIRSLQVGESAWLGAMVECGDIKCVNATYEYQSDDDGVISIDGSGVVTALKTGNANIVIIANYSLENSNGDTENRTAEKSLEISVTECGGTAGEGYVVFNDLYGVALTDKWTIDVDGVDVFAYLYDGDGNKAMDAVPTWEYRLYDKSGNQIEDMKRYCRVSIDGNCLWTHAVYPSYYGLYELSIVVTYDNGVSGKLTLGLDKLY